MMTFEPAVDTTRSTTARPPVPTLRRCACGGGSGALAECAACRRARSRREGGTLRRQEATKEKSTEEKLTEAAKKTGEALLETSVGKELKKNATELGKDFVSTLPGKVITGTAAAGAIAYIVAKNKELPVGIPEIPLDRVTPGLKAKITWEGPVRTPKKAMITFTWSPGAPAKKKRAAPTEREKFRAETARMAKEQAEFREGLKSPDQRAAEDEAFWKAYWGGMGKYGLRPLNVPGLEPKEEDETPMLRRSAAMDTAPRVAPPIVHETLREGGEALPADVRSELESRLGHDFGHVRIHADARAAESASAVGAHAYTVGRDVVFGAGRWSPRTPDGRRLLAHELAHVAQHDGGRDGGSAAIEVGRSDDPLEAEADQLAMRALAAGPAKAAATTPVARNARMLRREDGDAPPKEEEQKEPQPQTSTPRITGSKVTAEGAQQLSVGAIDVLIKPDVRGDATVDAGETTKKIEVTPKKFDVPYTLDSAGRIKTFTAPEQKVTVTIQTSYGVDVDPTGRSAYGRGTTPEDIAAGNTSLKFHEGQHGLDFVQYLRDNPFPRFGGRKGMKLEAFSAAVTEYLEAVEKYGEAMDEAVLQSGDCVGISIDTHRSGDPKWNPVCQPAPQAEAAP